MNDIPGSKRGIGFVFQNYALFRYMTVADNIAFGLEVQKKSKAEIKNQVEELLGLVSMQELDKRYSPSAIRRAKAEGGIYTCMGA